MADRVGQQLGNYRLSRLLGTGGFAEVYLGEHIYLKTPAAIKLLQTNVGSPEDLEGFLKEAQTIAQLVHPHIVRVMDFGVDGNTPFLVMDYAPGGTLRQRHPKGTQLPLSTILPYVKQVAEALQYAHEEKFIHRDVKPENMLVGRRDAVLLSDFGIALMAQSSRYQSTQEVIGTVASMSPEQIQGKPRPSSDQYSLAIVVYEWLSGDRPFHGSFTELCTQHLFAPPRPLHKMLPMLSPEVEHVVMTALNKDPKGRFGSVQAFATALEQASQGAPDVASPQSHGAQPQSAIPIRSSPQDVSDRTSPAELTLLPPEPTVSSNQTSIPPTQGATPRNQGSFSGAEFVTSVSQVSSPSADLPPPLRPVAARPEAMIPLKPRKPKPGISKGRMMLLIGVALVVTLGGAGVLYTRFNDHAPGTTQAFQKANPYPPHSGNLVLDDPLSTNDQGNQWIVFSDPHHRFACQFSNGAYHASLSNPGIFNCTAKASAFSNFAYQVQMTILKGNCGGLVFRDHSDQGQFYFYLICQDGTYSLRLYTGSKFVPLLSPHFSSAVHAGLNASNLLAVVANGAVMTLFVNHQSIDHAIDSTFSQGEIGVLVSVSDTPTEVAFSNVKVWTW